MREIKFRGKNSPQHSWVYGYYHTHYDGSFFNLISKVDPEEMTTHEYPVDERSVGQFIGRIDKNGKEIYSGDIVKWGHLNQHSSENPVRLAVVEFDPDIQFKMLDRPEYKICFMEINHRFHFGSFAYANSTERDLEVIGNIYDNPEFAV